MLYHICQKLEVIKVAQCVHRVIQGTEKNMTVCV